MSPLCLSLPTTGKLTLFWTYSVIFHAGLMALLVFTTVAPGSDSPFVVIDLISTPASQAAQPIVTAQPRPRAEPIAHQTVTPPTSQTESQAPSANSSEVGFDLEQILGRGNPADPTAIYFTQLYRLINRAKAYPQMARQLGVQGLVKLQLRISQDGKILDVAVTHSDHTLLEKAAIETITKLKALPRPEFALSTASFVVSVPLRYQLR